MLKFFLKDEKQRKHFSPHPGQTILVLSGSNFMYLLSSAKFFEGVLRWRLKALDFFRNKDISRNL
jgi:hypothetical protein